MSGGVVPNLVSELQPVKGRPPLTGTNFAKAQFDPSTMYVFVSVETDAVTVRFDGTDGGTAPYHTLAKGTSGVWSLSTILKAKFAGAGAVVITELTR